MTRIERGVSAWTWGFTQQSPWIGAGWHGFIEFQESGPGRRIPSNLHDMCPSSVGDTSTPTLGTIKVSMGYDTLLESPCPKETFRLASTGQALTISAFEPSGKPGYKRCDYVTTFNMVTPGQQRVERLETRNGVTGVADCKWVNVTTTSIVPTSAVIAYRRGCPQ